MGYKIKIKDTDVINLYNIDFYEVDGRKIIFYAKGSKYDCIFKTDEDALLAFDKLNKYSGAEDLTKDGPKIRRW